MKKTTFVIVLLAAIAATGFAQTGIRPILSGQWDVYFNDAEGAAATGRTLEKNVFDVNGVLIFPFADWISLESKGQFQFTGWTEPATSDWFEVTLSAAPIFVFSPFYVILRPGVGIGNGVEITDQNSQAVEISYDMTVDANLETERWYANLTARGSWYRAQETWFVIPAAGVTHTFPGGVRLGTKVFYGYTDDYGNGNAIHSVSDLTTVSFPLGERTRLTVGGSVGWTRTLTTDGAATVLRNDSLDGSVLIGVQFPAAQNIGMRYQLEPIIRRDAGPGLSNTLVLDARL